MHEPDDNFYSSIEDLAPEPRPKEGTSRVRVRELAIGLVLVLGVLGWGGWQWWHQQDTQANYRLAQEAAARQDWDATLSHYTAADGYKDADARRADAAKQVSERDRRYATAVASADKGDWASALQAVEALRRIQPDYKDTQELGADAKSQVYRQALHGAIAQRTGGERAGLYYRDADGWTWLQGTDRDSAVRSMGLDSCAIYDVPGPDWKPEPTPHPANRPDRFVPGSPFFDGRSLRAFSTDGNSTKSTPLAFDPVDYLLYVCAEHGVWALHYGQDEPPSGLSNWYTGYDMDYQPFGSASVTPVSLPGPDWWIVDLSRDGNHVLLAELGESADDAGKPSTRVYLADPDGGNRRPVYSGDVSLLGARLAPGGDYALLHVTEPVAPTTVEKMVVLLDLKTNRPPKTLAARLTGASYLDMKATFLSKGAFAGKVLLVEWHDGSMDMSVLDPSNPDKPVADARYTAYPSFSISRPWVIEQDGKSDLALVWQDYLDTSSPYADGIAVLKVLPGDYPVHSTQPFGLGERLADVSVTEQHLLYGGWSENTSSEDEHTFSLRSLPISGLGDQDTQATLVYSYTEKSPSFPLFTRPLNAGPRMLAYTENGQLYARTYDGKISLPLEMGVIEIYDNVNVFSLDWLW